MRGSRSQHQFFHCSTRGGPVTQGRSTSLVCRQVASDGSHRWRVPAKEIRWTGQGSRKYATAAATTAPDENESVPGRFTFRNDASRGNGKSSSTKSGSILNPPTKIDQKELHNYAARFGCVPKVRFVCTGTKKRRKYRISIEVEEHQIRAEQTRPVMALAYQDAMADFKKQADAFCETNPAAAAAMSSTSLTTENAHYFLSFCRSKDSKTIIDVREEYGPAQQLLHQIYQATPLLNDEPLSDPVLSSSKSDALHNAKLIAAVVLRQQRAEIWPEFVEELKKGSGHILRPIKPNVPFPVDKDCLLSMRDTIRQVRQAGPPRNHDTPELDAGAEQESRQFRRFRMRPEFAARRSRELQDQLRQLEENPNMAEIRAKVRALPASQSREEILSMINNNVYSIVVGATGSGKTTQVPQILLDHAIKEGNGPECNIITTQPRRIAATSVATRVAAERNRKIRDTVGYNIRFDCKAPYPIGGITYSTTGILLTQLQNGQDELLDTTSHLIIDEVHERDLDLDFLMITIKKAIEARIEAGKRVPKVIFMSATLDTSLFAKYFQNKSPNGDLVPCPHVDVPGRTYPVREHYLENVMETLYRDNNGSTSLNSLLEEQMTAKYLPAEEAHATRSAGIENSREHDRGATSVDWGNLHNPLVDLEEDDSVSQQYEDPQVPIGLAAATVAQITKTSSNGAILVFLPGYDGIKKLETILSMDRPLGVDFADEQKFKIIKLHSSIDSTQTDVFNDVDDGCRKIILSTNIAETSVTIPDIRYVVDAGKVNQKIYNPQRRIGKLACCWTSKSNCRQRAGRAGRVQDGNYYALFPRARFNSLRSVGLSEMQRLDLQEVCLRVKAGSFSEDVRGFLGGSIEPPLPSQVDSSMQELKAVGALDGEERITPLGRLLSKLPLSPALGKMVVLGIVFRCLDPILVLAAASGEMDIFTRPLPGNRDKAFTLRSKFARGSESDHMAILNAFHKLRDEWNSAGPDSSYRYAVDKMLNFRAFRSIRLAAAQIETILSNAGLIPSSDESPRSFRIRSQFGGPAMNINSFRKPLIKAILLSALFPNLAVKNVPRLNGWRTEREASALLNPKSVNAKTKKQKEDPMPRGSLMTFSSMSEPASSQTLFLVNTTRVLPLMVCLFGGQLRRQGPILFTDNWLPMHVYIQEKPESGGNLAAELVVKFRQTLDEVSTVILSLTSGVTACIWMRFANCC